MDSNEIMYRLPLFNSSSLEDILQRMLLPENLIVKASFNSDSCLRAISCKNCYKCSIVYYCDDCRDCKFCSFCTGLQSKQYMIFNQQLEEHEYWYLMHTWVDVLNNKDIPAHLIVQKHRIEYQIKMIKAENSLKEKKTKPIEIVNNIPIIDYPMSSCITA